MKLSTKKHCVYLHRIDGVAVYVGKGFGGRAFDCIRGRSPQWRKMMESAEWFDVEILAWFDTAEEAFDYERATIKAMRPVLNLTHAGNATAKRGKPWTEARRKAQREG